MASLPAVEKSPFKDEIIHKLINGVSPRDVEKWLVSKGKEYKISHTALNNYRNNHIDLVGKAKKKVEKRKAKKQIQNKIYDAVNNEADIIEEIETKANNLADGIEALQKNVRTKKKIKVNTDIEIDLEKETPMQREKFRHDVKKSMNDDIKLLHEIYKDNPENPDININFVNKSEDLSKMFKKKLEELKAGNNASSK